MRIGILLTGDYSWAGGLYYSLNIIKLLQNISLNRKLIIVVIINKNTPKDILNELQLSNIEIVNLDEKSKAYKIVAKLVGLIRNTNYRFIRDINRLNLNIIYPLLKYEEAHSQLNCKIYYWLFDFQHKFLPEFFSEEEINRRNQNFENIANSSKNIVLSSYDSKKHFEHFYPNTKSKVDVYHFVSLIKKSSKDFKTEIETKIPEKYFIVCNQFWAHKNHIVVLQALKLLIEKSQMVHFVFTGKYKDENNEAYANKLFSFIEEKGLTKSITFTGFISRQEQINLIEKSQAVIQPSKFEGWSTVVEDAKALNKFLLLSDIPINREQISTNVLFFEQDDFAKLAQHIQQINENKIIVEMYNYENDIEESKLKLINLFGIT